MRRRRRRRRRRSLETQRRDRGISVRGARISRGVRAHLELDELLHGVGLVSHRAPTRLTRGADFCVRGLEGRRARVSREGGGGRVARGCFAGGDASTKATGWARRTTGASVECGAPRLRRVQTNPTAQPRNIRAMGGAKASPVFPRRKGTTRRAARLAEMVMTRVFAVLAALAAVSLPSAAAACADAPAKFAPLQPVRAVRRVGSRMPATCVRTTLQFPKGRMTHLASRRSPSLRRRSGLRRNPTRSNGSSVGPRFVSRARSRAPAGRRPRRRLARDPRDLAPKHEDIVRFARLLGFPPLAALDPLR